MLNTADVTLFLHVAPITRQNISSHVFHTRLVHNVQVQFSQSLQPASLASIQMRLYINILQGFVVCVHSTLGAVQVMAPFHAGLENGHELTVGYMVSSLSGS